MQSSHPYFLIVPSLSLYMTSFCEILELIEILIAISMIPKSLGFVVRAESSLNLKGVPTASGQTKSRLQQPIWHPSIPL